MGMDIGIEMEQFFVRFLQYLFGEWIWKSFSCFFYSISLGHQLLCRIRRMVPRQLGKKFQSDVDNQSSRCFVFLYSMGQSLAFYSYGRSDIQELVKRSLPSHSYDRFDITNSVEQSLAQCLQCPIPKRTIPCVLFPFIYPILHSMTHPLAQSLPYPSSIMSNLHRENHFSDFAHHANTGRLSYIHELALPDKTAQRSGFRLL
jgi:hypothetical protein